MGGWSYLILGILFEVVGTFCLKLSHGFSNLMPSVFGFLFFAIAICFVTLSAKTLDVGIVYAVWAGAGIVLITLIGTLWFAEQLTWPKLLFILLILVGVVGLHQVSKEEIVEDQSHVNSVK